MKEKKNGFAISGILYPLLILTLFLVVQMLFMLQTRKNVLDKARSELADSVNTSNVVYTNEELSTLVDDQKAEIASLKTIINNNKVDADKQFSNILDKFLNTKKEFKLNKFITGNNYTNTKIVINTGKSSTVMAAEIMLYGGYNNINYGGFVSYSYGSVLAYGLCHGGGADIRKGGQFGNIVTSITPTCSTDSKGNQVVTFAISINAAAPGTDGSYIYADIIYHDGQIVSDSATATMP